MMRSALISSLYLGFLAFAVLTLLFGQTGVAARERLSLRREALSENLEVLESKRVGLESMLASLRQDPESIVVEARSLGLYRREDRVVMMRNLEAERSLPDAGRVLHLDAIRRTDDYGIRIAALAVGLAALLSSFIIGRLRSAGSPK